MPIQKVSEMESEPVVGRFYLVPCLWDRSEWVPVVGPEHDDKEYIGVSERHYHRDVRFMNDRQVGTDYDWYVPRVVTCLPEQLKMSVVENANHEPLLKRRKCWRRMPDFPLNIIDAKPPAWRAKLERAYKNASSICGRCPHKGMRLKGLPVKDGKVICNGHGLQFNVETGEMVSRLGDA